MSDYTITGAVASNNITDPLKLNPGASLDIIVTADITITLTIANTIVFPATITAESLGISSDVITWASLVTDTLAAPPVEITISATSTPVMQPIRVVSQNYLITVTDGDARTQTFNIAVDNEDGYPTATLQVIDGYPSPAGIGTKPDAPTSLGATATSSTDIGLSWTAPAFPGSTPISGYQIERESPIGGGFVIVVADTGTTATTYADSGLVASTEYNYRVSAINTSGVGAASNTSAAGALPLAPTSLVATTASATQIDLAWTTPVDPGTSAITGYQIERESPIGGGFSIIVADTGTTATTYPNTGLVTATQYNYRVAAINISGVGPVSNEDDDTTL
jgi:Fibronectin type III domain